MSFENFGVHCLRHVFEKIVVKALGFHSFTERATDTETTQNIDSHLFPPSPTLSITIQILSAVTIFYQRFLYGFWNMGVVWTQPPRNGGEHVFWKMVKNIFARGGGGTSTLRVMMYHVYWLRAVTFIFYRR